MSTVELAIGFALPTIIMLIAYAKEEVWLFYWASVLWLILMGFLFNNYGSTEFWYYIAYTLLIPAIICATAQLWMNKGKPMPQEPEETQIEKREKRSQKLAGLRNLANKIKGKD